MSNWNQFDAPNAGLLFFKRIYKEQEIKQKIKLNGSELIIDVPKDEKRESPFDGYYKDLYQKSIDKYKQIENKGASETFTLFTTYPGLLVGSGYPHDTKAKGDFRIGFYFDHTSGQPVIPGSSVKGVLNSVFELDVTDKGKNYTGEKSVEFAKWLLSDISETSIAESLDAKLLRQMQQEIFGDEDKSGNDVFFDAVINKEKTGDKPFLANDFITHHENPLKNPNPIQFLKVLPGIGFEFRFKLTDKTTWKPDLKVKLFNKIILTLGLGAKTNVGYGQFITEEEYQKQLQEASVNRKAISDSKDNSKGLPSNKREEYKDNFNKFEFKSKIERQADKLRSGSKINKLQISENEKEQFIFLDKVELKKTKVNAKVIFVDSNNIEVIPFIHGLPDGCKIKITLNRLDEKKYNINQIVTIQISAKKGNLPDINLQAKLI